MPNCVVNFLPVKTGKLSKSYSSHAKHGFKVVLTLNLALWLSLEWFASTNLTLKNEPQNHRTISSDCKKPKSFCHMLRRYRSKIHFANVLRVRHGNLGRWLSRYFIVRYLKVFSFAPIGKFVRMHNSGWLNLLTCGKIATETALFLKCSTIEFVLNPALKKCYFTRKIFVGFIHTLVWNWISFEINPL